MEASAKSPEEARENAAGSATTKRTLEAMARHRGHFWRILRKNGKTIDGDDIFEVTCRKCRAHGMQVEGEEAVYSNEATSCAEVKNKRG